MLLRTRPVGSGTARAGGRAAGFSVPPMANTRPAAALIAVNAAAFSVMGGVVPWSVAV